MESKEWSDCPVYWAAAEPGENLMLIQSLATVL
jgi:hypothetical protein